MQTVKFNCEGADPLVHDLVDSCQQTPMHKQDADFFRAILTRHAEVGAQPEGETLTTKAREHLSGYSDCNLQFADGTLDRKSLTEALADFALSQLRAAKEYLGHKPSCHFMFCVACNTGDQPYSEHGKLWHANEKMYVPCLKEPCSCGFAERFGDL